MWVLRVLDFQLISLDAMLSGFTLNILEEHLRMVVMRKSGLMFADRMIWGFGSGKI